MEVLLVLLAAGAASLVWIAAGLAGGLPGYLLWSVTEDRPAIGLRVAHTLGFLLMLTGWVAASYASAVLVFGYGGL